MGARIPAGVAAVRDESGLRVVELVPHRPPLRVVGPGRLERGYQRRLAELQERLEEAEGGRCALAGELELAQLVERGSQRYLDRVERSLGDARRELSGARGVERRLCAAMGALQRENELLRLERSRLLAPVASPPLLARLFGRRGRRAH